MHKNPHRVQNAKGTRDQFEHELLVIERVTSLFSKAARSWGFGRIDVPTFEHLEVFTQTSEFSPNKNYCFKDKAGRDLVLRPDINGPLSRAVVQNFSQGPFPVKLFFADKVFRYRKSKKREFRMFCLENYGIAGYSAEAEILRLVLDVLEQVGFSGAEIEYSNLALISVLLQESIAKCGISTDVSKLIYEIRAVKQLSQLEDLLRSRGFSIPIVDTLTSVFFCSRDNDENFRVLDTIRKEYPSTEHECDRIFQFRDALASYGISNLRFSIGNLHGSGFYSDMTYRLYPDGCPAELADGGRYDEMTSRLGGPAIPATGLGFGIERFIRFAKALGLSIVDDPKPEGIVVMHDGTTNPEFIRKSLAEIRSKGLRVEEDIRGKAIRKAAQEATMRGYQYVVSLETPEDDHDSLIVKVIFLNEDRKAETNRVKSSHLSSVLLNLIT